MLSGSVDRYNVSLITNFAVNSFSTKFMPNYPLNFRFLICICDSKQPLIVFYFFNFHQDVQIIREKIKLFNQIKDKSTDSSINLKVIQNMDHAFHNSVKNILMTLKTLYYAMNVYIYFPLSVLMFTRELYVKLFLGDKNNVKYTWQDNQTKIILSLHILYMAGTIFLLSNACILQHLAWPFLAVFQQGKSIL